MDTRTLTNKERKARKKAVSFGLPSIEQTPYIPRFDSAPSVPLVKQQPVMQRWESRASDVPQPPSSGPSSGGKEAALKMMNNPMVIAAVSSVALVALGYFVHKRYNLFSSPEKEATPEEPLITEEDKARWHAEQVALEKTKMREAVENLRTKMAGIHSELHRNQHEAVQNEANYKKMFSGEEGRTGHDEDLSSMETESNLNTSFMLKEDMENKKAGMVALGKELGEQHRHLIGELGKIKEALHNINSNWMEQYPDEEPLFMESQSAPSVPRVRFEE